MTQATADAGDHDQLGRRAKAQLGPPRACSFGTMPAGWRGWPPVTPRRCGDFCDTAAAAQRAGTAAHPMSIVSHVAAQNSTTAKPRQSRSDQSESARATRPEQEPTHIHITSTSTSIPIIPVPIHSSSTSSPLLAHRLFFPFHLSPLPLPLHPALLFSAVLFSFFLVPSPTRRARFQTLGSNSSRHRTEPGLHQRLGPREFELSPRREFLSQSFTLLCLAEPILHRSTLRADQVSTTPRSNREDTR